MVDVNTACILVQGMNKKKTVNSIYFPYTHTYNIIYSKLNYIPSPFCWNQAFVIYKRSIRVCICTYLSYILYIYYVYCTTICIMCIIIYRIRTSFKCMYISYLTINTVGFEIVRLRKIYTRYYRTYFILYA